MEYLLYKHSALVEYCATYPALDMIEISRLLETKHIDALRQANTKWPDGRNALSFSNPENGLSILVVNV